MTTDDVMTRRLVGIFLFGCILLSYPVMTMFNVNILLFGIPLLYLYIFVFWLIIILLIFLVSRKHKNKMPTEASDQFYLADPEK